MIELKQLKVFVFLGLSLLILSSTTTGFVIPNKITLSSSSSPLLAKKEKKDDNDEGSSLPIFTGGAFDKVESDAASIAASRIKSIKDLGWTKPSKRKGSARPRHRAYGGEGEEPVQLKPNYDESNPQCVEKWLTQEEMELKCKIPKGPISDTIFVALAGGGAFAERDVCEKRIQQWKTPFDEDAFIQTVQQGRIQLGLGWVIFSSAITFAATGIAFPTNPAMKVLEGVVDIVRGQVGG
mmetsp:Transcript_37299/g.42610  ORF Transcript_37299/g.42610 Transcript_37299/m.42610 type:complete len:238 (+) Transcript_37299:81-794(+)|eukprot:CAMPEP_0194146596 /NCGR_PEP_ID=MMETSP0152-20130528/20968_1 /TAXON_ID=1049557 /ORGANISM="Thalassiothrix antarctica, Strain L6-D1" /LENGTH=237 /DNA_ID=CAMNT_0038847147 /DNA_START=58 /DNA_END=771 /DNA_ORIENTATION=+